MNMETGLFLAATAAGIAYTQWTYAKRPAGTPKMTAGGSGAVAVAAPVHKGKVTLDTNLPMDSEGRIHHLHVRDEDVAHRILSVGDLGRGERIARQLDSGTEVKKIVSTRGFVTFTGTFNGVPVSIVVTGMGYPMMDFVVRETRAIKSGPMAVVRYGTCGGLRDTPAPAVVVAGKGAIGIWRDPDLITEAIAQTNSGTSVAVSGFSGLPYKVSKPVLPDAQLSTLYEECFREILSSDPSIGVPIPVLSGIDAQGDSFYASQGRTNRSFYDYNDVLVDKLEDAFPDLKTLEMESFHLLDLGRSSRPEAKVHTAAAAMVILNRRDGRIIDTDLLMKLEAVGGRAALTALTRFQL